MKRRVRAGVEDRWHRRPLRAEEVEAPVDRPRPGSWCTDTKHGTSGTLVTTVRHGRGKRWLARWVDQDGNERSKAFDRKVDAQQHINSITSAIAAGTYADPHRGGATFGVVAEEWFGSKAALKPKTIVGYRGLLDVVVLPRWGKVKLNDIDHASLQAWVSWLTSDPAARQRPAMDAAGGPSPCKGLSAARAIQAFQVVDQVLRYAVRSRYIAINPADDVQQPRKPIRDMMALTHAQVHQLAKAAGELGTMIYVLAYGGLRYGECAAMRVGDVDLAKRRVRVSRSVTYVNGMGQVEGATKTHQLRIVPLPAFVVDRLSDELAGRDPGQRVFPHHNGGAIPLDWFRVRFDRACATVGLTGVSPHTLRHTAGSLALASGASIVTVQRLLGHKDATTTMNVYSHMLPDDFDNLAAAMHAAACAAADFG